LKKLLNKINQSNIHANSISNVMLFFWNVLSVIIITPFVYKNIGKDNYGIWVYIMTILSYSNLLYLGLGSAIIKFIAEYVASKQILKLNKLLSTLFGIYLFLGFIALFFSIVIVIILPNILHTDKVSIYYAQIAILIIGLTFGFGFVMSTFSSIIVGMQRYVVVNCINLITSILYFFLALTIVPFLKNVIALAMLTSITTVLGMLIEFFYVKKEFPFIKVSIYDFDRTAVSSLFKFSLKSFFIQMSTQINNQLAVIIIGSRLGPGYVAQYSIPQRMALYIQDLQNAVCGAFFPKFTQLYSEKNYQKINQYWLQLCNISLTIALYFTGMFFVYGDILQKLWMGDSFIVYHSVIIILCMYILIQQPINTILLMSTNKHGKPAVFFLIESIFIIALSFLLLKKWGLSGVAFATLIPGIIVRLFILPFLIIKDFNISIRCYLINSNLVPIAGALVPLILLFLIRQKFSSPDLITIIIIGTIYSIITAISVLMVNKDVKNFLLQTLKKIF
jgi:O-antigen/teichoic acid export membrane protein